MASWSFDWVVGIRLLMSLLKKLGRQKSTRWLCLSSTSNYSQSQFPKGINKCPHTVTIKKNYQLNPQMFYFVFLSHVACCCVRRLTVQYNSVLHHACCTTVPSEGTMVHITSHFSDRCATWNIHMR